MQQRNAVAAYILEDLFHCTAKAVHSSTPTLADAVREIHRRAAQPVRKAGMPAYGACSMRLALPSETPARWLGQLVATVSQAQRGQEPPKTHWVAGCKANGRCKMMV